MLDLVLTTPPAAELVTLAQLKAHLRIEAEDASQDPDIAAYYAAALGALDGYSGTLGRALASQTWTLYLDRFPRGGSANSVLNGIRLPLPPLISVGSIAYVDSAGVTQTLVADTDYQVLAGERAEIRPAYGKTWPSTRCQPRAVTIAFTCGFAAPAAPATWPAKIQPVLAALKLMVGDLYAFRETAGGADVSFAIPMSAAVQNLLRPLRVPHL
jgi:uncharacterized phiE125 gp8 family phage protein